METKSNISILGYRRRMMQAMASKSELPKGYFPCEYIESEGTSFIDTGLLGKSGLQVKCKCSFNDVTSVHNVFGVLEGTNRLFIQYDNAEGLLYAYGAWNDTNAIISANEAYEMDATFNVGSQSFKLDGTELYSGTSSTNISTSINAYLFALNLNGTPNLQAKMRLYYCKIYDNGTLVRDYIPCVNPEGYFGLYDNITCEFYGFAKEGAGEVGTYVVGRGKVILPSGYTNAEYIESDGNAWVDSGYFPNGNTKVVMDAQMNSYLSGTSAFFGAVDTRNKTSFAFLDAASRSDYYAYYYGSSSTASNGITVGMFDRGLIIADKGTVDYHGNIVSLADARFTSPNTLFLFCGNENGTLNYYASMRLYQCQIHDNGIFTKFFIPCMKDGVFGLYEMFEKVFYSSEGIYEFRGQLNQ